MAGAALARGVSAHRVPKPLVLYAVAFLGCAAAAVSLGLALANDQLSQPALRAFFLDWVTLPYIAGGLVAWRCRPDTGFGPLLVAAGFVNFLGTFEWVTSDPWFTIGVVFDLLPPVVFLHVFLAFPGGRPERRFAGVVVAAAYVTAIGLQLARMMLGGAGHNLLELTTQPAAAQALLMIQLVGTSAVCLAGIGVLAARRRRAGRPLRRTRALLVDSFALGLVMIAVLLLAEAFGAPGVEPIRWAAFAVIGIAPVAFLVALLQARLARSAVGDLFIELRADPGPAELRNCLARALGDPSLELAYWLPQCGSWADLEGRPAELPAAGGRRTATLIEQDGAPMAALVHDRSLAQEPGLLDAVTAAARMALDNGRLHAELRARLEELAGSRARILKAAQQERQRLERDLHDGAQQRLIALSLELGRLAERLGGDPGARARLDQARGEIGRSLQELREVAHGIHPAVVSNHGLAVALESLAARAAVPVRLTVGFEGRLPEQLEVAAYYVIAESLANIGKHARATSATVDVWRANGDLVAEIADDGAGGADTERGTGLRGLADRVEALGGRLRVWSPAGQGTRVRAEIPCG